MGKKLALHWQILIGMIAGIVVGIVASQLSLNQVVIDYLKPLGTIFINLLKLIAIPIILTSLIKGVVDLKDIARFSSLGLRTLTIFIITTFCAVTIGLVMVNLIKPGSYVSAETITELSTSFSDAANKKMETAAAQKNTGPLQFLVDMVPDNIFSAAGNNSNMLQVIFFSVFFGLALLLIDKAKAKPVIDFIDGTNDVIMKMVDLIMMTAPYAVFALLASLVVETGDPGLFKALGWYMLTVVLGLIMMMGVYMIMLKLFAKQSPLVFMRAMAPAQLLAFSTSSSAATLPVTMERVEEHLGVHKDVVSFVCPVGATVNMDGTSLYQAVAAVFICEALQFDLTLMDQLTIVLTATLASIGSAAVPGAGMVMLVVVLETLGLPKESMAIGLALIFAVDRPLDMARTIINVSGDATVACIMGRQFDKKSRS
jgi:Na+/H+-dicarboxylate symporter